MSLTSVFSKGNSYPTESGQHLRFIFIHTYILLDILFKCVLIITDWNRNRIQESILSSSPRKLDPVINKNKMPETVLQGEKKPCGGMEGDKWEIAICPGWLRGKKKRMMAEEKKSDAKFPQFSYLLVQGLAKSEESSGFTWRRELLIIIDDNYWHASVF